MAYNQCMDQAADDTAITREAALFAIEESPSDDHVVPAVSPEQPITPDMEVCALLTRPQLYTL